MSRSKSIGNLKPNTATLQDSNNINDDNCYFDAEDKK